MRGWGLNSEKHDGLCGSQNASTVYTFYDPSQAPNASLAPTRNPSMPTYTLHASHNEKRETRVRRVTGALVPASPPSTRHSLSLALPVGPSSPSSCTTSSPARKANSAFCSMLLNSVLRGSARSVGRSLALLRILRSPGQPALCLRGCIPFPSLRGVVCLPEAVLVTASTPTSVRVSSLFAQSATALPTAPDMGDTHLGSHPASSSMSTMGCPLVHPACERLLT